MPQVSVSEAAIRDLVREAFDNKDMGVGVFDPMVNVSDVVDPSQPITNPSNSTHRPSDRVELVVAIKAICDDLPDEVVPGVYDKLVNAVKISQAAKDDDQMKKKEAKPDTQAEAVVRAAVRKMLKEAWVGDVWSDETTHKGKKVGPVVGDRPEVTKIPPGASGRNYDAELAGHKAKLKKLLGNAEVNTELAAMPDEEALPGTTPKSDLHRKFSTVADVDGMGFSDMAAELGLATSAAKRAVDFAMRKAQWVAQMQEENPEDLEILMLQSMNDYIKYLNKSGELSAADVQLLKDHPEIVSELDGFREFADKAIRKARKLDAKGQTEEDPIEGE